MLRNISEYELYMNPYIYTLSSKRNTSIKYNVCQVVQGKKYKGKGAYLVQG